MDKTPPTLTLPATITAEATGPDGAVVGYTATAFDSVDGAVSVTCTPASGSTFPLGTTTVNCSASDNSGNNTGDSFMVTVVDTTAPAVTVPANITANAMSPSGAVVTFAASALDTVDETLTPACSPASGSTFTFGTTTVTCTATDVHHSTGTNSFTVAVLTATQMTTNSIAATMQLGFQQGTALLQNVAQSIARGSQTASCTQLSAFINQVEAQRGKQLTVSQANGLITEAGRIHAALGCQRGR